jgi:hypothetical protein
MEEHPILMEWQNQYHENGSTTKGSLYVQYSPHHNSIDILHRDRKVIPKVHMEAQKTSNSQGNHASKIARPEVS